MVNIFCIFILFTTSLFRDIHTTVKEKNYEVFLESRLKAIRKEAKNIISTFTCIISASNIKMYRKLSELWHAFQVLQVKLESVLSTDFYRERSNSCSEGVVPNP